MIILFEENEILFKGLGIGVLKDAISCTVKEELNDAFELQLVYPITGKFYEKLQLNKIIFCKPNPYTDAQPFRIYNISKPINGKVTVSAFHISYDMNGLPVKPIDGKTVKDTLDKIQNGSLVSHNFKLYTDKNDTKAFKTSNYYNMRALLLGSNDSVLEKYEGEMYFDKFNVYLLKQRGSNKGAQVRYAKNLKDIIHEISYDRLYNGVYPYYHQETTSQTTTTSQDGFQQVYIVGSKPYQDGWLSFTQDGEPYHPVDESPVQVATEGNFYQKVYCWNTTTQRYVEKIYNEVVTLIDQVGNLLKSTDTPSWIYIDWSKLPTITCKAGVDGYFKLVTESEWVYHKKGEIIFENSIKDAATNLMIYYSEVIPASSSSETEETTTVTHIELDDKIIYLDTDAAREMKFNRILSLDLTSEFTEPPTKEQLELKAKEYVEKNKIGQYKYSTTVTFVDLSSTTEGASYEKMEAVELGDIIKVVYDDLGVNVDLRVISTQYNVLLNRYDKIELGEKPEKISGESIQNGDNVSSLTNDVGYTDVNTVNKLIAKTVTADFIKALNAEFSKAQIEELSTARIKVTGMIESSQFELDNLIAKMLTADNAKIKETLEAGNIKVAGDITITKGEIDIISTAEDGTSIVFRVDRNGNLTANSVKITGGELNINDIFNVTPDGILSAQGAQISGDVQILSGSIQIGNKFQVTEDGSVTATGATISGHISADTGEIAGFTIDQDIYGKYLKATYGSSAILISPNYDLTIDSISKHWSIIAGLTSSSSGGTTTYSSKFKVSRDGYVYAKDLYISGGTINIDDKFKVDSMGKVSIKSGSIEIKNSSNVTMFSVSELGHLMAADVEITGGTLNINNKFIVGLTGNVSIKSGNIEIKNASDVTTFSVSDLGHLTAADVEITGGTLNINNKFTVDATGKVSIKSGSIEIKNGSNVTTFSVSDSGHVVAADVEITGGQLHIQGASSQFGVSTNGKLTAVEADILGKITATSGYIGTATKGFTITETAISNGFSSVTSQALSGGVYVGTDGIRVGQDSTRSKTFWSLHTIYTSTAQYLDITDSSYPNDNYAGSIFELTYYSASYARVIKFTPVKSDHSAIYDAKTIEVELPAVSVPGVLSTKRFSLTQSQYFDVRYTTEGSDTNTAIGIGLKTLVGFVVNQYGDIIMRDATVRGSFQGDVNITGGTLNIHNSGNTKVFSVTSDGELTATGANITGQIQANTGNIGPFSITSNYISTGPTSGNDITHLGLYLASDGLNMVPLLQYDSVELTALRQINMVSNLVIDNVSHGCTFHTKEYSKPSILVKDDEFIAGPDIFVMQRRGINLNAAGREGYCTFAIRNDWTDASTAGERVVIDCYNSNINVNNADLRIGCGQALKYYNEGSYGCRPTVYIYMSSANSLGKLEGTWQLSNGTAITSDRNAKHDIENLSDKYSELFDNLKPVRFKYNSGTSNRYHTGFIAQDIEEAIDQSDLTTSDVAMFIKSEAFDWKNNVYLDSGFEYSIRYDELHALEVNEIQKLKKRVAELEALLQDKS